MADVQDFIKRLYAKDDDTMWRAAKMIEDLMAQNEEKTRQLHDYRCAVSNLQPFVNSVGYDHPKSVEELGRLNKKLRAAIEEKVFSYSWNAFQKVETDASK